MWLTDDPDYRFTYKVVHAYCVQSTGPLLPEQLVQEPAGDLSEGFADWLSEKSGCRVIVVRAHIAADETNSKDWALF